MAFTAAMPVAPLRVTGPSGGESGTEVTFLASPKTFTMTDFDFATLEHRLRELAFLNSGVPILLTDKRGADEKRESCIRGRHRGLRAPPRQGQDAARCRADRASAAERDDVTVDAALWWNDGYHENVLCFTNNIPQRTAAPTSPASAGR